MTTTCELHLRRRTLLGAGTLGTAAVLGLDPAARAAGSEPGLQPDHITLNPTEDNTTTLTVTWRTSPEVQTPHLQVSADTANPWGFDTVTVDASDSVTRDSGAGYEHTHHSATATGLQPGTTYLYRVGDGTNYSGWMPVTTCDPDAQRTSLIAMGDIQTGHTEHWTRVALAALKDRPQARALITAGDQVNTWDSAAEWHALNRAAGKLPRTMIWNPAVGNHEYRSTDSGELSAQYRDQFDLPLNGPDDFEHFAETVYYHDVDDIRVVTMNTYYRIPRNTADELRWLTSQAAWLDEILTDSPREFTIVVMHYPVYSSSPDRGNPELRAYIEPVLEKHGVDLVLAGHDHAYVSGQREMAGEDTGPVFVTSSSSNRQYPLQVTDWYDNGALPRTAYHSRSTYQLIDVEDGTLSYTAKDSTGAVTDEWEIIHHPEGGRTVTHVGGVGIPEEHLPEEDPTSPFVDVDPSDEHFEAMLWAYDSGVARGWADGTYRPLTAVNRDAMAAFLHRLAGEPAVTLPKTSPFSDVAPSAEHYAAIIWAHQEGITTGWSDGTFRPTAPIARDAMAAFVYRFAGSPDAAAPDVDPFTDVSKTSKFAKEIAWMKAEGIAEGWSDGTYRPLQDVKRDAMAAFLYRLQVENGIEYAG
ncbi:S-layer homology domain-containing protein [Brachybacterium sp. UMB0905]|uniref:S-layer homology domain-containing protein n=1 Tax=Brachybacterium sp. UMB0905 TaxID=2069310 RepID=UPI000C7FAE9F|nr:S-layer homology domain-containing protein [Brachybacterium sp. UMB0905]PMC76957.1 hypothetical protein CJ197_01210 [Brachybacterium sp. UMB0905]